MVRKVSVKKVGRDFQAECTDIERVLQGAKTANLGAAFMSSIYDYAIIRLHAAFESFIFRALVGVMNNNTRSVSAATGVFFPRHLTGDVCEYLVTRGRYFDARGRSHLIDVLQGFLPPTVYLVQVVRDSRFQDSLDKLWALRNFAAHRSGKAKRAALQVASAQNMSSAGAWLKNHGRYDAIVRDLTQLSNEVITGAPY
jgi:hypothetical protein